MSYPAFVLYETIVTIIGLVGIKKKTHTISSYSWTNILLTNLVQLSQIKFYDDIKKPDKFRWTVNNYYS